MDEKGLLVRYYKLVEGLLTFWENFGDLIGKLTFWYMVSFIY